MEFRNHTDFQDGLAIGMGPDRLAHIGCILKATYRIPEKVDDELVLADEQHEILSGDVFIEGDVLGSLEYDFETYVFKPYADIIVNGSAYAPDRRPVNALNVAVRVGRHEWAMRVSGDRRWIFPTRAVMVPLISDIQPFVQMPLRYERSFGGFDHLARKWCAENPIGKGFIGRKTRESVHESHLPNIEDPQVMIRSWDDQPRTVGWGFIRKDWSPRSAFSGRQIDNLHPEFGLPADFDHRYFNGAHPDLQIPFLKGDEIVELQHLTPDAYRRFQLPGITPSVEISRYTDGASIDDEDYDPEIERPVVKEKPAMRLDTLVLMPDKGIFTIVWRANTPIKDLELQDIASIDYTINSETASPYSPAARPYAR